MMKTNDTFKKRVRRGEGNSFSKKSKLDPLVETFQTNKAAKTITKFMKQTNPTNFFSHKDLQDMRGLKIVHIENSPEVEYNHLEDFMKQREKLKYQPLQLNTQYVSEEAYMNAIHNLITFCGKKNYLHKSILFKTTAMINSYLNQYFKVVPFPQTIDLALLAMASLSLVDKMESYYTINVKELIKTQSFTVKQIFQKELDIANVLKGDFDPISMDKFFYFMILCRIEPDDNEKIIDICKSLLPFVSMTQFKPSMIVASVIVSMFPKKINKVEEISGYTQKQLKPCIEKMIHIRNNEKSVFPWLNQYL